MISVVIPVYNGEGVVGRCLHALARQSYRGKKEVIVVDDGSVDGTVREVKQFRGVKLLKQRHAGPAAARNRGVAAARSEIVLFTDADCVPAKDWIEEMIRPLAHKEVCGVQGAYKTRQKGVVARFVQREIEDRYDRMTGFSRIDFVGTYAAGYRKSVFSEFGGFDESFPAASGEDSEFSFRLSLAGHTLVFNPQAVVFHEHPTSLVDYLWVKFWRAYWRVPLYRKHARKMVTESYTPQGLKLQIGLLYLFFLLLIVSVVVGRVFLLALAVYVAFLLSTVPFSAKVFVKDKMVGLIAPGMLHLRSIIFGLGLLEGAMRELWGGGGGK